MADPQIVGKVDFADGKGERKLKAQNKYIREALEQSKKSIMELADDPIAGWPYLIQALVSGGTLRPITLDAASALFDSYLAEHKDLKGLGEQITKSINGYFHVEQVKPEGEESDAPNADTQAAS